MKTRTKTLLILGVLLWPITALIILAGAGYWYLIYNTYTYSEDLKFVDNSVYVFCQDIANNPKFTQRPVYFRIDRGTYIVKMFDKVYPGGALAVTPGGLYPFQKTIFITPKALKSEYLDVIVAHELGHIQNIVEGKSSANLVENEQAADIFAAEIVGTMRLLKFRLPPVNQDR